MSQRTVFSIVAAVFGLIGSISSSYAGLAVLQQSVSVNKAAADATFTIDFSHPPDFFTLDSANRPADSFSIEIAANPTGPNPLAFSKLTSIIRGDEIHFTDMVAIRNVTPAASSPMAGGWGSLRGAVPFTISGNAITFTTTLQQIGAPSGKFAYLALTTHHGVEVASGQGASVPLPSALSAGMLMLAIGIAIRLCKPVLLATVRA